MTSRDWYWKAHLDDGTELVQDKGVYSNLPRNRLVAFDLWDNSRLICRLDLRPDWYGHKALIWRRRTRQDNHGNKMSWHILGWQQDAWGVVIHNLLYVMEADGSILLGGEPSFGDIQDPIEPFPWETDLRMVMIAENG